ncbi:nicotinamide riboside kinase 1-like [Tetranychus urticae]|uniref:nicotinamide riboside kinase 1-like n=1 Tax=Tetranychus urticae TaxID=32264 RepID=UPI00077BF190|nr:nicotinamide riboside kinase 1-like [Tetranychus urticae]
MTKVTIVGISGVTNGGKTTLSTKIIEKFPNSILIRQDDYFREEDDPNHIWITLKSGRKHQNWESLNAVNWDKLKSQVNLTLSELSNTSNPLLIIEGHLIFNYRNFPFKFDLKFFFTLPKEECFRRRLDRNYVPADPPGYFDEIVWPMYLKNKEGMGKSTHDIIYIKGTDDTQQIFNDVLQRINKTC